MPRRVFFSFHYSRDIRRVVQVRNSWRIRQGNDTQPFLDKADWESIKRTGDASIRSWIEDQLKGTSVTVVLAGAETANRPWVRYEITRSLGLGKGVVVVRIHNIKDPQVGTDYQGSNPLDGFTVYRAGLNLPASSVFRTYDWVINNGYANLESWIEEAVNLSGR